MEYKMKYFVIATLLLSVVACTDPVPTPQPTPTPSEAPTPNMRDAVDMRWRDAFDAHVQYNTGKGANPELIAAMGRASTARGQAVEACTYERASCSALADVAMAEIGDYRELVNQQ